MQCRRCHGLMRCETFHDWGDGQLTYGCFEGWRCLACGNVWDPVIAANRVHPGDALVCPQRRRRAP